MAANPWTADRKPSPGDAVQRDDGRVCRVKGYVEIFRKNPTQKGPTPRMGPVGAADLPPTQAGLLADYPPVLMECGEKVSPRMVSMCVFWPTVVLEEPTCAKCKR